MSKISRADSKARFRTGMYPTQADFENLHDSYVHKDDTIPLEQVGTNGVTVVSLLNQKANSSHTHEIADVNGLQAFITKVNTFLGTVDASDDTINRWKEIEAFLSGITDTETLTGLLAALKSEIEGNLSIDATLSSTSEHALQNKVLYNELRVSESGNGAVLTVNGTNYPIEVLDADTFVKKDWTDNYDTSHEAYLFPQLYENKAYIVTNVYDEMLDGSHLSKSFGFTSQGNFKVKFAQSAEEAEYGDAVSVVTSSPVETPSEYEPQWSSSSALGISTNTWVAIPATSPFITRIGEPYSQDYQWDTSTQYYGLDGDTYDGFHVTEIPAIQNATETTGSTSTVKSLKTKIAELEARLAAVPTNYLEFTFDMSAYASAEVGKVLLYLGATTQDFTHCYFYEKTASGWKNARVSPVIQ